jgi:UDP-glucose 4-epimerase
MQHASSSGARLRVAVTGAAGNFGRLLLPKLEADPSVEAILALDIRKPLQTGPKVAFERVDLVRHDAEAALADHLKKQRIDALYHLAFHLGAGRGASSHELEVMGTLQILGAVASAVTPRLIVPSLTALYGARPQHPAFIPEATPLEGCPQSRFVQDKVRVEDQLRAFRRSHPATRVIILRFAPVVGPDCDNPFTRFLRSRAVPTLLGFDPVMQVVHQDDAVQALSLALHADAEGEFNIVGEGVMSLSGLVRQAGSVPLPLAAPLAEAALKALSLTGTTNIPSSLLSYLHYSWAADGSRARSSLGYRPVHHVRDAAKSLKRG